MKELKEFTVERLESWIADDPNKVYHVEGLDLQSLAKIALAAKKAEVVAYITYKGHLLHAADPKVAEHSDPEPLYDAPPLNHAEQDEYWYEVECYKYKGPAKLCAGNTGPAWYFPGSDLLVDNDEVKVIGRTAAPKPESE